MKMPSTNSFTLITQTLLPQWQGLDADELVEAMEEWARVNLQPKQAVVGTGILLVEFAPDDPSPLNYWILRHNNYDNGDDNIEVQIRYVDLDTQETVLYASKNDVLTHGVINTYREDERHVRVRDPESPNGRTWQMERNPGHPGVGRLPKILFNGPAVRAPILFMQCEELALNLSQWLLKNIPMIREQVSPKQIEALQAMFHCPMMWLAVEPLSSSGPISSQLIAIAKGDLDWLEIPKTFPRYSQDMANWRRELKRDNRIATQDQTELYVRLKASVDWVEKHREPLTRDISLQKLLELYTRWLSEVAKYVEFFRK